MNYINSEIRIISDIFNSAKVTEIDSVFLRCLLYNESILNIILKNVLHVSAAIYNLLSTNITQKVSAHFQTEDSTLYILSELIFA